MYIHIIKFSVVVSLMWINLKFWNIWKSCGFCFILLEFESVSDFFSRLFIILNLKRSCTYDVLLSIDGSFYLSFFSWNLKDELVFQLSNSSILFRKGLHILSLFQKMLRGKNFLWIPNNSILLFLRKFSFFFRFLSIWI